MGKSPVTELCVAAASWLSTFLQQGKTLCTLNRASDLRLDFQVQCSEVLNQFPIAAISARDLVDFKAKIKEFVRWILLSYTV